MTAPTNGARLKQQGWGVGGDRSRRDSILKKKWMKREIYRTEARGTRIGMYNENPTAGRAVCRPMLCDAKKTGGGFFNCKKKRAERRSVEVPRLPIVKPEEGERSCRGGRPAGNKYTQQASGQHFVKTTTGLQEKKKKKKRKRRGKKT